MKKIIYSFLFLILFFPYSVFAVNGYTTDLELSSSQYWSIIHGNQTNLNQNGDLSWFAWINFESVPAGLTALLADYTDGSNPGDMLAFSGSATNKLKFWKNNTSVEILESTVTFTPSTNTWYHIGITFQESTKQLKFFLDGDILGTATTTSYGHVANSETFRVGAYGSGLSPFDGKIDDVRIYSEVISEADILAYYNCGLVDYTGLDAYWKFENNGNDETVNNNDLTNNNSATFQSVSLPFTDDCAAEEEPTATTTPAVMYMTYTDDISIVHKFTTQYNASGTIIGYTESDEYHQFNQFLFWVIVEAFIAFVLIYFHLLYEKKKKRF